MGTVHSLCKSHNRQADLFEASGTHPGSLLDVKLFTLSTPSVTARFKNEVC